MKISHKQYEAVCCAFILEWRDAVSAGVMDWFPVTWFAREGVTKNLNHPIGADGRPQGKAFCDLMVKGNTAELDYRPYPKLNEANEVLSGVVRLTFTDDDRAAIANVAWKAVREAEFALADFRLHPIVLPSVPAPYQPTAEHAGRAERSVRERPGQAKFRRDLKLSYGSRCCISGCAITEVLEGAHIDPYQNPASNHVQNGLLLRADLHTLFDKYLISINPDTMQVHVSKRASGGAGYEQWHGSKISVSEEPTHRPDHQALRRHWQKRHV